MRPATAVAIDALAAIVDGFLALFRELALLIEQTGLLEKRYEAGILRACGHLMVLFDFPKLNFLSPFHDEPPGTPHRVLGEVCKSSLDQAASDCGFHQLLVLPCRQRTD